MFVELLNLHPKKDFLLASTVAEKYYAIVDIEPTFLLAHSLFEPRVCVCITMLMVCSQICECRIALDLKPKEDISILKYCEQAKLFDN